MKRGLDRQLDPTRRSKAVADFELNLRRKVVGQDPAVDAVVGIYQMFKAGFNPPDHPIGNLLFLGPTGTGKTRVVEAAAEVLFGSHHALIKVDCGEFQHSHEISKLVGSPPGYLGHRETHPVLTQEAINQYHSEELKLTFVLFDEIEKASDALWQLLLGVLDKGVITLGDNRRIDLSCCVIVMTANVGAAEMSSMVKQGIGFVTAKKISNLDDKIQRTALEAAKRKFSPEFMNRIDKSVVFKTLRPDHLVQVLELELGAVQQRVYEAVGANKFILECNADVKDYLLENGISAEYGARYLKRLLDNKLVMPLSSLSDTGQIQPGDLIRVSRGGDEDFIFVADADTSSVAGRLAELKPRPKFIPPPVAVQEKEEPVAIKQARQSIKEAEDELQRLRELRKKLMEESLR